MTKTKKVVKKSSKTSKKTTKKKTKKINMIKELITRVKNLLSKFKKEKVNIDVKTLTSKDIEEEFKEALIGIKKLPNSSKFGVYLAYRYYVSLFNKIKKTSAHQILNERIRINNSKKISLMMGSYLQFKFTGI